MSKIRLSFGKDKKENKDEQLQFYSSKKKKIPTEHIFIVLGVIVVIILVIFGIIKMKNGGKSLFDLGNLMNQEAVDKNEEQENIHSLILRNAIWGASMNDVALEEKGNLVDYGDDYLTCDWETLFGRTWLPTYLFKDDKLVAIVYEANLSLENIEELSSIHQDVSVNIHYVYEQLYRENNKWVTGQERKYDKNLWTNALINGKLSMQSVWNSKNEKVFLVTNNKALFGFLEKIKGQRQKAYMTFIIVADDYLLDNSFDNLLKITPSSKNQTSLKVGNEDIQMVAPDDINVDGDVYSTTNYTTTGHGENLTDEEFNAIYNELNGITDGNTVDEEGNIIDSNGKIIGNVNDPEYQESLRKKQNKTAGGSTTMHNNTGISGGSYNGDSNTTSNSNNNSNSINRNNSTGTNNGSNNGTGNIGNTGNTENSSNSYGQSNGSQNATQNNGTNTNSGNSGGSVTNNSTTSDSDYDVMSQSLEEQKQLAENTKNNATPIPSSNNKINRQ